MEMKYDNYRNIVYIECGDEPFFVPGFFSEHFAWRIQWGHLFKIDTSRILTQ